VKGDDLMASNVVPRGDARGDVHRPAVVVGNELIGTPGPTAGRARNQTNCVDLEEVEACFVHGLTGSITTICEVCDDWPVVAVGPWSPLELDGATSGDSGMGIRILGVQMADDVWAGIVRW